MIGVLGFDSWWGLGIFLFITMSRMALGPTQPPIQWVPWALSLGVKWLWCEADHLHLVLRSMHGAILPLPNMPSWCDAQLKKAQGKLYLYLYRYLTTEG
jgi:hypothetical protein